MPTKDYVFTGVFKQDQLSFADEAGATIPASGTNNGVPIGSTIMYTGKASQLTVVDDDVLLEDNNNAPGGKPIVESQTLDKTLQNLKAPFETNLAGDYVWSRAFMDVQDAEGNVGRIYQIRMGNYNYSGTGIADYNLLEPTRFNQYWAVSGSVKWGPGTKLTVFGGFNGNGNQGLVEFEKPKFPKCFVRGSSIETQAGNVNVESLKVGDMVLTKDNGYQAIRWIGSSIVGQDKLEAAPQLAPVRIQKNALGNGFPQADLYVSPQHRMLLSNEFAMRAFGVAEVLVPAKNLVGAEGIDYVTNFDEVEYFHILFDGHEVVRANGTWSESLYAGQEALKTLSNEAQAEILELFPEFADEAFIATPACTIVDGKGARAIVRKSQVKQAQLVDASYL